MPATPFRRYDIITPMSLLEWIAVASSLIIITAVIALIRTGRLLEKYSILWLGASATLLLLSIFRPLIDVLAHAIGIAYPPSFVFLVWFVFLMLILLHFSVVISTLSNKNRKLAQELGLLKTEIEEIKKRVKT